MRPGGFAFQVPDDDDDEKPCEVCKEAIYSPAERTSVDGRMFHKACFRCSDCRTTLKPGNFTALDGQFFCKPHYKQRFLQKGNYSEGFGKEKHSAKWLSPSDEGGAAPPDSSSSAAAAAGPTSSDGAAAEASAAVSE